MPGFDCSNNAAVPEAWGVAMLVPLASVKKSSTTRPMLVPLARQETIL
jgi:hypothetical protein